MCMNPQAPFSGLLQSQRVSFRYPVYASNWRNPTQFTFSEKQSDPVIQLSHRYFQ